MSEIAVTADTDLAATVSDLAARVEVAEAERAKLADQLVKLTADARQDERLAEMEMAIAELRGALSASENARVSVAAKADALESALAKAEAEIATLADPQGGPVLTDPEIRLFRTILRKYFAHELANAESE